MSIFSLLQNHNHLLWCSNSKEPDLGGKEAITNKCGKLNPTYASLSVICLYPSLLGMDNKAFSSIEVNTDGASPSACLELEISALAMNTIIQSHHINNIEDR